MSNKIIKALSDNKVVIGSVLGLGAAAFFAYKLFIDNTPQNPAPENPNLPISQKLQQLQAHELELQELKSKINPKQMKIEQLKELFDYIVRETHRNLTEHQVGFKEQRRGLKNIDFKQYLDCLVRGMVKMQEISVETQRKVLEEVGMSREQFEAACMANPHAFANLPNIPTEYKELSVNELKEVFKFQKKYLNDKRESLCEQIQEVTADWDMASKRMIPGLISLIMTDEIHEQMGYDEEQIEQSTIKYENQLMHELIQVRDLMLPLLARFDNNFGHAGMMDPRMMDPSMMMDPGQMMMMDPSMMMMDPNMMSEFERLSGDPAMMEKIMAMMHQNQ